MSWIKSLIKSKFNSEEEASRDITTPGDLEVGDVISFTFNNLNEFSNKSFEIMDIDTIDLGGDSNKHAVYTIQSAKDLYKIKFVTSRNEQSVEALMQVYPDDVKQFIDVNQFMSVLERNAEEMTTIEKPKQFSNWLGEYYGQIQIQQAYIYSGNYTKKSFGEDDREEVDYYRLVSDDGEYTIYIHVYNSGQTDVFIGRVQPDRIIEAFGAKAE